MSDYTVSISVVTYNSEEYIGKMLDSISNHVHSVKYKIFVIDNCSTDGTADIVKRRNDNIVLIRNDHNLGFGKGHNQVLEMIDSKYHVCINPDIYIETDVIGSMCEYLDQHSDIGILTPKVLYPNGDLQILPKKDPKFIYLVSRRIGFSTLKKYREKYEMLEMGVDNAYDIEFATGCFMFMRTDLLKKAGGFDERFFLYFEDADLARSIRKFARAEYNPQFTVYHYWERAGAKKAKYFIIQIASMFKYLTKWRKSHR
ncbi:MAG: glycosyltransferase family 2 protein [Christensenellales bacterium]|jgi:GT2 family glycosyltransferase